MTDGIETEAILHAITYSSKSGWKGNFQIEEEAARQLDAIGVGRRFVAVLVPITDDEKPDAEAVRKSASRAQMAGILCGDPVFQEYLEQSFPKGMAACDGNFRDVLRGVLGVESRAELDSDKTAAALWDKLRADFEHWKRT